MKEQQPEIQHFSVACVSYLEISGPMCLQAGATELLLSSLLMASEWFVLG